MKIPLFYTLITICLVTNIRCIQPQNQHQPTSYATSNIQTQYRQIDNYINSNVVPQQQHQKSQTSLEPNLFQNIDDSLFRIVPNSENYNQYTNKGQTKTPNNYNNQEPQLFYVKVDKSLPQVQEQYQGSSEQEQYLLRQHNENILRSSVPSTQYSSGVEAGQQIQNYPEQIQQNPKVQTIQTTNLIPAQQQTIPLEKYPQFTVQNQPEALPNPVVYQPQSEQIYQHQQHQELPQNIPIQYNYDTLQEKPSQVINYPAYQQVLVNNESLAKPKQNSGYKVRESPVERQTEEFSPTNNAFAGPQIIRNNQLFHDLAVHGSYSQDGNVFEQLNYPNQQIGRSQQLSRNTYDVFSDSIQGQLNMGLSAYSSSDGTPQQRLLNSGL